VIVRSVDAKRVEIFEGASRKTLAVGEKMMIVEFTFREGSVLPAHKHPNEQVGYVVKGRLKLRIGEAEHDLEAGDSYYIEPNVEHSATIIDDSKIIDVFCPPREDYR